MKLSEGALIDSSSIRPRWLRVKDAVRYSSIPHTSFYELINSGEIRTAALLKKGNNASIRLVDIESLDEYLKKHSQGGTPKAQQSSTPIAISPLGNRKPAQGRRPPPGKKTASNHPKTEPAQQHQPIQDRALTNTPSQA
jgi:hypothetical protein